MTDRHDPTGPYNAYRQLAPGIEYLHNVQMGDMFRFPGDPRMVYGPVAAVESSYMLDWTDVRFAIDVPVLHRHAFARIEITKRGPRCECGLSYDRCENECPWPDEIEKLWRASF